MTSAVVDLAEETTWDPASLTAAAFHWPVEPEHFTFVAVTEVATVLKPDGWAGEGTPVITPSSLDPTYGGVRRRSTKHQGAVFTVTNAGPGLHPLDVLVPPKADLPALLVSPDHVGSTVSGRFLAVRAPSSHAYWLWAVLSSQRGREARAHATVMHQGLGRPFTGLLDLKLPWPTYAGIGERAQELARIEQATRRPEEEAAETWWTVVNLRGPDWYRALATPNPQHLDDSQPLGDFCREVISGHLTRGAMGLAPVPGLMPVAEIAVLGGKPVRRWADPELPGAGLVEPGDILLSNVGKRPHAMVATDYYVLHTNVFGLRLHEPEWASAIVRYLNGPEGYGLRQGLLTGSTIPHLNKTNLLRLPVALSALEPSRPVEPPFPLAQQLEQLLWT